MSAKLQESGKMMEREEKKNNDLPEGWKTAKLADLFEIKQGKSLSAKRQTGKSLKPFLRTSNVLWGKLDLSEIDQMDFSEKECAELALKYDDLLVCEDGDIGRTAIWRNEIEECYYQNHIHRLRQKTKDVYPLFMMYWLRAGITQLRIYEGFANKTTIPNLSRSRLSEFVVPLPEINEQKGIASILYSIDQKIELTERKKQTLNNLFQSMLNKLMTGQSLSLHWKLINVE